MGQSIAELIKYSDTGNSKNAMKFKFFLTLVYGIQSEILHEMVG